MVRSATIFSCTIILLSGDGVCKSKLSNALQRLESKPSDYTQEELIGLMTALGYELKASGGSRRKFIQAEMKATLFLHQPHRKMF